MAEDFGDKTEAPTPRKRQEAREQGKVARSRDLATAALIVGSMVLLQNYGPGVVAALRTLVDEMLGSEAMSDTAPGGALQACLRAVVGTGIALAPLLVGMALIVVIAIVEYIYQRWKIEQELKMTKQEVKDEMRRMEGDPQIKQKRRSIAMHAARERMKKDVPTADVVVTNPTEFAVALKYDAGTMHAPRVVAKGQGLMAQRIREIAIAHGVPILERKPLARALFKLCEVGQEIPEEFFSAVAEILAYVYELTGKSRRAAAV